MKFLLSRLATRRGPGDRRGGQRHAMVMDVKGAFLYGHARRRIYIELPETDPAAKDGSMVGIIERALYGTRDAPQLWQEHARMTLLGLGFRESVVCPSVYVHDGRGVELCLHVDDILAVGDLLDLTWVRSELEKHYTMKATILGPGHALEATYLGRTIRYEDSGVSLEHNEKHVTDLLETLGMVTCRGVETPIVPEEHRDDQDDEELDASSASRYRRCAAIVVYLGQDRPDLSVAGCHLARGMATPTTSDWMRLKRVARYVQQYPRLILRYPFQEYTEKAVLMTDSDWGNEVRTRKSHSGGVIMLGQHCVSHWCRIQPVIALSSGEAELYAAVAGLSRLLGLVHVGRELRGENWGQLEH